MSLLIWGITIGTIGKLILGIAVLRVHIRIFHEHSIDGAVLSAIKREHYVTVIGLACIVVGYFLEIFFYNGSTQLFNCIGAECASAIDAAFNQR